MSTTFKCGEFQRYNTMTKTQIKKHITQMNDLEKQMVKLAISQVNVNKMYVSPHLVEKMEKQGITFDVNIMKKAMKNFDLEKNLIEINYNEDKSTRVLIRCNDILDVNVNGKMTKCKLAFVYNFKNHHIATCYYNDLVAINRIPNLRRYDSSLDIVKHLKPYIN